MAEPAIPSQNPANDGTLPGTFNTVLTKFQQRLASQLPAIVLAYDRTRNVATVRPMVPMLTTEGQAVQRATVAEVPVLALAGGGYVLSFPVKAGDLGWIEASDRDISLFMQHMSEAAPNTLRLHSFEDSRFIPDAFRSYSIQGEDADRVVLQALDGSTRVALGPGIVKITAPTGVEIVTPLAKFSADVEVAGDVVASGISLVNHIHGGVQPGSGNSGPPQ